MKYKTHLDLSAAIPQKWDHREQMYEDVVKGTGVEIGVFNGDNAAELLKRSEKIYLVDRWVMQKAPQELVDEHQKRRANVYSRFEGKPVEIVEMSSEDASFEIPETSLDWVYIDANHAFAAALWDMYLWTPLLKVGGILMLHDFTIKISGGAVIDATNEYVKREGTLKPIGKTTENDRSKLQTPTIALKKIKHKKFYKKWW